jgi:hypothetical protein
MTGRHVHRLVDPEIEPKMPLHEILWYSFEHMYHLDHSNAPIHTNTVRYSPLTFRLAEYIWSVFPSYRLNQDLRAVVLDSGRYEEDPGR